LLIAGLAFDRTMNALAVIKRHYRIVMRAGGSSLVILGILQVTGLWTQLTGRLQTTSGNRDLPL